MAGRRRREVPTARVEAPAKGPHRSPFVSLVPTQLVASGQRKCDRDARRAPRRGDAIAIICVFPSHLLGLRVERGEEPFCCEEDVGQQTSDAPGPPRGGGPLGTVGGTGRCFYAGCAVFR